MSRPLLSVVIPTLQLSPLLPDLLHTYQEHPRVGEIIVINNAPAPLAVRTSKMRVLDQASNIFVNPAWNLGARSASHPLLAISNDDISVDADLLDRALARLDMPGVGMIGGDLRPGRVARGRPRFRRTYRRPEGFGVLMFMRTADYVEIPEEMKIWQGDDYLFHRQRGRNYVFRGFRLETPHHTSAGRAEFNKQKSDDFALYMRRYHEDSAYWAQRGLDFTALRALVSIKRRIHPLPRTWEERRGA